MGRRGQDAAEGSAPLEAHWEVAARALRLCTKGFTVPDGLFLGKTVDPASGKLGEAFVVDPDDLTTHGIVIGMTGSGKTGLSVVLIEEALMKGIPVIVIDPKGDMGNLALAFSQLRPDEFEPWVDLDATQGATRAAAAAETARAWSDGLAEWGLGTADVARYKASREVRIITPGSFAGIPLNLIEKLDPPGPEIAEDEEAFRDQIDSIVVALLGLVGLDADPVQSRDYILLFTLIEHAWRQGQSLTLESLIGLLASPPIDKLGALPLDVVYPPAERNKLMLALNGLLASPPMEAWRQGEPVDIDSWLRTADGRPRVNIVYTAHLEEDQRVFVTALILNKIVSWVRRQPGTDNLRCLLYMDEIFGYFPPTANPPTKKPLLTLLKQARAHGLGVLLSTQNPVDLDYRGLANMGFWAIGRLQTTQDQGRIRSGIEAALADSSITQDFDSLISGVRKRVFLIKDIHRKTPALVHSRWALSYLRGPITRQEIETLQGPVERAQPGAGSQPADASGAPARGRAHPAPVMQGPPPLPAPLRAQYLVQHGGEFATPYVLVKSAVRYKIGSVSTDDQVQCLAFRLDPGIGPMETLEGTPVAVQESALADVAPRPLTYGELPAYLSIDGPKALERALRERLDDKLAVDVLYDPATKTVSRPGEDEMTFALRVRGLPGQQSKRSSIESKLQAKRATLLSKQSEVKARGMEKWASLGTSILSNIGILSGRRRTVTGVGGVLSKQRMESTARNKIEQIEGEIAGLEEQLATLGEVDPSRFERRTVKPARADVAIIRYGILWIS